jgi:hypothetical protein
MPVWYVIRIRSAQRLNSETYRHCSSRMRAARNSANSPFVPSSGYHSMICVGVTTNCRAHKAHCRLPSSARTDPTRRTSARSGHRIELASGFEDTTSPINVTPNPARRGDAIMPAASTVDDDPYRGGTRQKAPAGRPATVRLTALTASARDTGIGRKRAQRFDSKHSGRHPMTGPHRVALARAVEVRRGNLLVRRGDPCRRPFLPPRPNPR